MISMFTSDSQHPQKSRHAVHLGDQLRLVYTFDICMMKIICMWNTIVSNHMLVHKDGALS